MRLFYFIVEYFRFDFMKRKKGIDFIVAMIILAVFYYLFKFILFISVIAE